MLTFRGYQNDPVHSHRLLYLHASARDYHTVNLNQRIKTQPDDDARPYIANIGSSYALRSKDNGKALNRSSNYSTGKIKYFDLDLKNLTQQSLPQHKTTNFSTNSSSIKSENSIFFFSNSSKAQLSALQNISSKDNNRTKQQIQTSNLKEKDHLRMLNLFDKENAEQLWQSVPFSQNKRIKQLQNKKEVDIKYNKFRQLQKNSLKGSVKSKIPKETWRKEKKEDRELVVKKIEKVLADRSGNEYKVTIERI